MKNGDFRHKKSQPFVELTFLERLGQKHHFDTKGEHLKTVRTPNRIISQDLALLSIRLS